MHRGIFYLSLVILTCTWSVMLATPVSVIATDTPRLFQKITFSYAHNTFISATDYTIVENRLRLFVEKLADLCPRPKNAVVRPFGGVPDEDTYPLHGTEFKNSPYINYLFIPYHDILGWNDDVPVVGGESSFAMRAQFNSIRFILQSAGVQFGNQHIFQSPVRGEDIKGYPKFNNQVILSKAGRGSPWRAATRKEYLEEAITAIKKSPRLLPNTYEYMCLVRAEKILDHLSPVEMELPAIVEKKKNNIVEFYSSDWNGFKDSAGANAVQLVIADEHYFDSSLPKTSIQLIAIVRNSGNTGDQWKADIKRLNFLLYAPGVLDAFHQLLEK